MKTIAKICEAVYIDDGFIQWQVLSELKEVKTLKCKGKQRKIKELRIENRLKKRCEKGDERISMVCQTRMIFIIDKVTEILERLEMKIKQAVLLTHPIFLIWKEIETDMGIQQMRLGLKLNMCVALYYLAKIATWHDTKPLKDKTEKTITLKKRLTIA